MLRENTIASARSHLATSEARPQTFRSVVPETATAAADQASSRPLSLRQRFRLGFGPGMFLGMTLADWLALLHENHFGIDITAPTGCAASISLNSLTNSTFRQIEDALLLPKIHAVQVQPPLFILGHARSGTTYLHNLLAMDQRFAYPNVYQVYYPHTFLCTEKVFAGFLALFLSKKRPQDNVALSIDMPAEDEVATCIATGQSPYICVYAASRKKASTTIVTTPSGPCQRTRGVHGKKRSCYFSRS